MRKRLTLALTLVLAVAVIGTVLTYAGARGFRARLTEEQRTAIRAKVETLKAEGASPEVIRTEVRTMLEGFGIKLPEDWGQRPRCGNGPFASLTEDQRSAIRATVQELKGNGASREEIRAAVREQLTAWGIEFPEKRGPFADLTEEQRAAIRATVQEMRGTGATREQIREAVGAKLQEWGVELPEELTPSAKVSATTAVQSASWGQLKSQFK